MIDRLAGIGRSGIGRAVEGWADPGVEARADRSVRVGVHEPGEVPQLVRGDGGREADEVGAGGGGLAGTAQEVIDVDPAVIGRDDFQAARGRECRRARDVEIAPVDLGRDSPLEANQRRVVEIDRGIGPRLRLGLGEDVREVGIVGRDLRLNRVALGLGVEVLAWELVGAEVEIDGAGDGPFDEVIAAHTDEHVLAAAPDQGVVVDAADYGIVVRAAQHAVDCEWVGQGQIERAVALRGRHHGLGPGLAEIDRDPGGGLREIEPGQGAARGPLGLEDRLAAARAAVEGEGIAAAPAHQRVVARAPHERVGAGRADQGVIADPALEDGASREARGVEREVAGAGPQDRVLEAADGGDRRGRASARGREGRIGERHVRRAVEHQPRIEPTADQVVVAAAARDRDIARPARDRAVAGAAVDEVVARAADDRVIAGAGVDRGVARAAGNDVVAVTADDQIGAAAAVNRAR